MPKNRNRILNLNDIRNIVKNNLSFAILYKYQNNSYRDILHYSEIFTDKETPYIVTKVTAIDQNDKPRKEIHGLEAVKLVSMLSDYNAKKSHNEAK